MLRCKQQNVSKLQTLLISCLKFVCWALIFIFNLRNSNKVIFSDRYFNWFSWIYDAREILNFKSFLNVIAFCILPHLAEELDENVCTLDLPYCTDIPSSRALLKLVQIKLISCRTKLFFWEFKKQTEFTNKLS